MSIRSPKSGATQKRVPIDWLQIRQRLENIRVDIEHATEPPPEEVKRILKARAEVLAQVPEPADSLDKYIEVVAFTLSGEHYAVESHYVREVYPLDQFTVLPCTPAFVLGIVNVRGEILSVLDLKQLFELPGPGLTDLNKVLVLQDGDMVFAILADVIGGVRNIPIAEIQSSMPTLTGVRAQYLRGVTADRLAILDAGKLLTDPDIIVHEQVSV